MATSRGRQTTKRHMAQLPAEIERKVLGGAARAGAKVVADEAKVRANNDEVRNGVVTRSRRTEDRITVRVTVKGAWARSLGTWAEYGTDPHFISVDESQRQGMSIGRINERRKEDALVIGDRFVGTTVFHPGARASPFLRPALDTKEAEALAAAQSYINRHVTRGGIIAASDPEDEG